MRRNVIGSTPAPDSTQPTRLTRQFPAQSAQHSGCLSGGHSYRHSLNNASRVAGSVLPQVAVGERTLAGRLRLTLRAAVRRSWVPDSAPYVRFQQVAGCGHTLMDLPNGSFPECSQSAAAAGQAPELRRCPVVQRIRMCVMVGHAGQLGGCDPVGHRPV